MERGEKREGEGEKRGEEGEKKRGGQGEKRRSQGREKGRGEKKRGGEETKKGEGRRRRKKGEGGGDEKKRGGEKLYSAENSPQGAWDNIAEEMLLEFAESGHPTFRATTPLSRGQFKSKGHGKLSIHFAADEVQQLKQFFALLFLSTSSVFTEQ